MKIMIYR